MINRAYVGDIGTVIDIDLQENISACSNQVLRVKRPDGSEVEWWAVLNGSTNLRHVSETGEFNVAGAYYINPYLRLGSWIGLGDTVILNVYPYYG